MSKGLLGALGISVVLAVGTPAFGGEKAAASKAAAKPAKVKPPRAIAVADAMKLRISGTDPVPVMRGSWRFPAPSGSMRGKPASNVVTKVCVTIDGAVSGVEILQSGGDMDADRVVIGAITGWKFKPYVVKKKAVPFCFEKTISSSTGAVQGVR